MSSETTLPKSASVSLSRRWMLIGAIVFVGIVLDHATKWLALEYLKGQPPLIYLGDLFRLQFATNTGAFLSLGAGLDDSIRPWIMTGLNSLILISVTAFVAFKRELATPAVWSLSLILSGGLGNLIDRVTRGGEVVDFMNIGMPWGPFQIRSGIFNVADIAIMAGLFLLIGLEIFGPRTDNNDGDDKTSASQEGSS